MNELSIVSLTGKEIGPHIEVLAQLRMQVFREYPYLYQGELKYEMDYLQTYVQCPKTTLVLAFDNKKIVGASTAIPLEFESKECQQPFIQNQFDISKYFYFGESVLLPQYRGKGIYKYFFKEREAAAREYGSEIATFCAVEREQPDPRRPSNYVPLDKIWQKFGYEKHPDLCAYFSWKEINATLETAKPMRFWMKNL